MENMIKIETRSSSDLYILHVIVHDKKHDGLTIPKQNTIRLLDFFSAQELHAFAITLHMFAVNQKKSHIIIYSLLSSQLSVRLFIVLTVYTPISYPSMLR